MKNIVCFGEVLWDVLPTESIAGGAPMNVAIRLQSLGFPTKIISQVGNDDLGKSLVSIINEKKVDTALIQVSETLGTGEVLVHLDEKGSATYDIVYPSAWDGIALTEANKNAVKESDAFVFGSLACRDAVSKNTLLELLKVAKYKLFDINIRPPFYSIALLEELMLLADFIKLNDEELLEVAHEMGSTTNSIEENIIFIANKTQTKTICITRGGDGAVLYINDTFYSHPGFKVTVADTIGAGDSFFASLLSKLLVSTDYQEAVTFGCAVGALVASQKGANPEIASNMINAFYTS